MTYLDNHPVPSFDFPVQYATCAQTQRLWTSLPAFDSDTECRNGTVMAPSRCPSVPRGPSFEVIRAYLLSNLPFFKLKDVVFTTLGHDSVDRPKSTAYGQLPKAYQFLKKRSNTRIRFKNFVEMDTNSTLRELMSTQHPASNKQVVFHCIFEAAAFLASNNELNTRSFIGLVEHYNVENILARFLRLGMPSTKIFGMQLMESSAEMGQQHLIKLFWASGVSVDHVAERLMRTIDPIFRKFVLTKLSAKSQFGKAGGRLLMEVIDNKDMASAEILIQAGADINLIDTWDTWEHKSLSSPILRAVYSENIDMVKLMVENGAQVNTRVYESDSTYTTPLTMAVMLGLSTIAAYLLDRRAIIEGHIGKEPILTYLETQMPDIYSTLVETGTRKEISVNDVLIAASDRRNLLCFLSEHSIPAEVAEEALKKALRTKKTKEIVNMIQQGVLRGCSNALEQVVESIRPFDTDSFDLVLLVTLLIKEGADANVGTILDSVLRWNLEYRTFTAFISFLIGAGFDIEQHGPRIVEQAMYGGYYDKALFLIEVGTNINSYGEYLTPFQAIALEGSITGLEDLLSQGAEINQPAHPHQGLTALQAACLGKSLRKTQLLIDSCAEVNASPATLGGVTALEATVRPASTIFDLLHEQPVDHDFYDNKEAAEVFSFLLGKGAFVNREDGSDSPLLHDIIQRGLTDILEKALNAGARTDGYWWIGSYLRCSLTPIQVAAERGDLESVRLLIMYGAEINAPANDDRGRTALQAAAVSERASTELTKLLLSHGADVHAPPARDGGVTALQGAAIQGYIDIALLLIENGAEINAMPALHNGRTAIEGAVEHGRRDMVMLLLKAGAIGDVLHGKGFSEAIRLAEENHRSDIVELLEAQARSLGSGFAGAGVLNAGTF